MLDEYEAGLALLSSGLPSARSKGARLLRRRLKRVNRFQEVVIGRAITEALRRETDESVQVALLHALGEAGYKGAAEAAAKFAESPRARTRVAAAHALAACVGRGRRALPALLKLSRDRNARVRDWACTGLQMSVDIYHHCDPDVLEALAARIDDQDEAVRDAAILGLAAAQDVRAKPALRREVESGRVSLFMALAARELGDEDTAQRLLEEWDTPL